MTEQANEYPAEQQDFTTSKAKLPGIDGAAHSGALIDPFSLPATQVNSDHGGVGTIEFRRLLDRSDFEDAVAFVDISIITARSSIGSHNHHDSFELYIVIEGHPLVTVGDRTIRLGRGGVALVSPGGKHSLLNDTNDRVVIAVIEIPKKEKN